MATTTPKLNPPLQVEEPWWCSENKLDMFLPLILVCTSRVSENLFSHVLSNTPLLSVCSTLTFSSLPADLEEWL